MIKSTKAYKFFDQVTQEVKKVVWPQRKELVASVGIVIIAVFLFSIATLVLDYGVHGAIQFLLNIGK